MDKFIEKYNLPKLNQEAAESLNRLITAAEIESVIKTSQHTKALDQMVSQENFTKRLRGANPYPSQTIPKKSNRGKTSKLFS